MIFNVDNVVLGFINLTHLTLYLIRVSFFYIQSNQNWSQTIILLICYVVLHISIFVAGLFSGFDIDSSRRQCFIERKQLDKCYGKGQDILSSLLPSFVKDRVRLGVRYIAEEQEGDVTIVFINICDFD